MPCYYCRNFKAHEDTRDRKLGVIESVRLTTGDCTLSPEWQTVTGLHFCSYFSPNSAGIVGDFWRRMHESSDSAERSRRIDAEKKLKQLRKRLRESGSKRRED
jgi:hypothetical protein